MPSDSPNKSTRRDPKAVAAPPRWFGDVWRRKSPADRRALAAWIVAHAEPEWRRAERTLERAAKADGPMTPEVRATIRRFLTALGRWAFGCALLDEVWADEEGAA